MTTRLALLLLSAALSTSALAAAPAATPVPAPAVATPAKIEMAGLTLQSSWVDAGKALGLQNVQCKGVKIPLAGGSPDLFCQFKFKKAPVVAGETATVDGSVLIKGDTIVFAGVVVPFAGANSEKAASAWVQRVASAQHLTVQAGPGGTLMMPAAKPGSALPPNTSAMLGKYVAKKSAVEAYAGPLDFLKLLSGAK